MDLSIYMIAATVIVFALGASIALAISVASGQWRNLDQAARIVLADDDESGREGVVV